jgi:hypothetical protein
MRFGVESDIVPDRNHAILGVADPTIGELPMANSTTYSGSGTFSGNMLTPEQSTVGTEPKRVRNPRTESAFGHSFHIFVGNGPLILRINNHEIAFDSDVTGSVGEMTQGDVPFIGNAVMRLCNIAPFDGGTFVFVEINWDTPLRFQVMLHYSM